MTTLTAPPQMTSTYFMDDEREAGRLAAKVEPREWIDTYLQTHLPEAGRVLDVGCGPGVIAAGIASRNPQLEVVGIDLSEHRIGVAKQEHASQSNIRFEQADIKSLPFEDSSFDTVYCRFLMEYLPQKGEAIREMLRVLRPGGKIVLQDLDGQLAWHYPMSVEMQTSIGLVFSQLEKTGFDPFVGRKLFTLLRAQGTSALSVDIAPYHLYAGTIDNKNGDLWRTKLDIARPVIEKALGGPDQADHFVGQFNRYLQNPNTLTYSVLFTVAGIKPLSQ